MSIRTIVKPNYLLVVLLSMLTVVKDIFGIAPKYTEWHWDQDLHSKLLNLRSIMILFTIPNSMIRTIVRPKDPRGIAPRNKISILISNYRQAQLFIGQVLK